MVPQSEHEGFESIAEIVPTCALPICVFGLANCGWLSTLNASMRISVENRPIFVFLISEASMLNCPGPRRMPRPALPYVPVLSEGGTKQEVSNQRSIVGLSSRPSQIWFGR